MNVKSGETKTDVFKNRDVGSINVTVNILKSTAGALAAADFLAENVLLRISLSRFGKNRLLVSDDLKFLGLASGFDTAQYDAILIKTTAFNYDGANTTFVVPIRVELGGIINLRDEDELSVTVQAASGCFGSNVNSTTSYIDVQIDEVYGIEHGTPYIKTYAINASESKVTIPLGDNVQRVVFINTDKVALTTNEVVSTVNLSADKFNLSADQRELMTMRFDVMKNYTDAMNRGNSHLIYNGEHLDNANLEIVFNSSNVAAGKNKVVWWPSFQDERLISLSAANMTKRNLERLAKRGFQGVGENLQSSQKAVIQHRKKVTPLHRKIP